MSTRKKMKFDKWVVIIGTGLVLLILLPFIFANPALKEESFNYVRHFFID